MYTAGVADQQWQLIEAMAKVDFHLDNELYLEYQLGSEQRRIV